MQLTEAPVFVTQLYPPFALIRHTYGTKVCKTQAGLQNWKNETNIPGSEIPRNSDTGLTAHFVTLCIFLEVKEL